MKIDTNELIGVALDWAVAHCEKEETLISNGKLNTFWTEDGYHPSTDWSHGGPIIEQEEIGIKRNSPCSDGRQWEASPSITAKGAGGKWGYGPTPLVAAMRCYVASKLGDSVEVPDDVLEKCDRHNFGPHLTPR
jgi:hypothetical protein